MNRAKSICTHPRCNKLIEGRGRCEQHKQDSSPRRLDSKKTPEDRKFYSSSKWTKTSLEHRRIEPLCRRCKLEGKVVQGTLVHHNPDRKQLLKEGKSPFDHAYLETLCFSHHQKELRAKQN